MTEPSQNSDIGKIECVNFIQTDNLANRCNLCIMGFFLMRIFLTFCYIVLISITVEITFALQGRVEFSGQEFSIHTCLQAIIE